MNDTFELGAKEVKRLKESFQLILDWAGFGKKTIHIPLAPIRFAARILNWTGLLWINEIASRDFVVNSDKAERNFGFSPVYSCSESLIRTCEWYIEKLGSADLIKPSPT